MKRSVTRDVGPLEMRAAIVPDSFDEDARTVDLIWSTGARVERGFWDRYIEELSLDPDHVRMGRLNGGAPLLDTHKRNDNSGVIGVVENASIDGAEGTATVRFAKEDPAESIFQKIKDRIIRNVSVGYRVYKLERVEEEDGSLPVMRATDWEPFEISIVPVGADAGAVVRSEMKTNACEFINHNKLTEEEDRAMKTRTPITEAPAETTTESASVADIEAAKAEERSRIVMIERTAKALGLGQDFVDKHVASGTEPESVRAIAFDAYEASRSSHVDEGARPDISAGDDRADKFMRGATDWLLQRSGVASKVVDAAKKRGEDVTIDPGEFRGMSMMDLAKASLDMGGVSYRGLSRMEIAGLALRSGMSTTGDFPVLLANVMNKSLLAAYELEDDTWRRWCATGSVSDFRAHNRYRRGSFGTLDTVAEHGEFTHKGIDDGRKESLTAATKGNLIAISRQALINDDMGAFNSLAIDIGQMAGLSIESDAYAQLALNAGLGPDMADGKSLFHADHNNIGAGAALSTTALDADDAIMGAQQDDNGNRYLNIRPWVLLVPRGLLKTAQLLNRSEFEVDTSARKAGVPNVVQGLFEDIVGTPYLASGTTRRYMFANPARVPTIEIAFLDGQEAPYLEMRPGWTVDGIEWKVRLDYAVGGVDYKGALTDAGA